MMFAADVLATDLPNFPFIVTAGSASREVTPDEAVISVSLLSFDEDPDKALNTLSKAFDSSLAVLKEFQIPISAVEASDLRRSTTRARNENRQSLQVLGYQISRSIHVQLNNLSNYSELAEKLSALPNLSSFEAAFDVSNRTEIEEALLLEASIKAVREAQITADAFGQKLDSVYAISEASNFGDFLATFGAQSYREYAELSDFRPSMKMFVPEAIRIYRSINVVHRLD